MSTLKRLGSRVAPAASSPLRPRRGLRNRVTYNVNKYNEEKNHVSWRTSRPHKTLGPVQGLEVVIKALTCHANAPGATVALAMASPRPAWVTHVVRGWAARKRKSETPWWVCISAPNQTKV